MVLPWIFYQEVIGRAKKLSDIEFLSIKEFDGKLKKNEGSLTGTGTLATLTASSGKDLYIARAKVIYRPLVGIAGTENAKIELQLNGVVIETAIFNSQSATTGNGMGYAPYEFKNIGHKVLATQVIKLEVTGFGGDVILEGFVECFEETTGESPQIPSI